MGTNMRNKDFIDKLAQCAGLSPAQVKRLLECTEDLIVNELRAGGSVNLPGVGKVLTRERPERMVRNPATGEQFRKQADRVVKVTIAKSLKDAINE